MAFALIETSHYAVIPLRFEHRPALRRVAKLLGEAQVFRFRNVAEFGPMLSVVVVQLLL